MHRTDIFATTWLRLWNLKVLKTLGPKLGRWRDIRFNAKLRSCFKTESVLRGDTEGMRQNVTAKQDSDHMNLFVVIRIFSLTLWLYSSG